MPAPNESKPRLTVTQRRVAELIGQGLSYATAAQRLGVQPATVKSHVQLIAMKLYNPDHLPPKLLVRIWMTRAA